MKGGDTIKQRTVRIIVVICLVVAYYFGLWQFDHTVAPPFWNNPLMHEKIIDGWFLGYLRGTDCYNTLMLILIFVPVGIGLLAVIPIQKKEAFKLNSNPLNHNETMTCRDSAIVALILTALLYFTTFLTLWNVMQIKAAVIDFCYASLQFRGASFLTEFVALAGIHKATKPTEKT